MLSAREDGARGAGAGQGRIVILDPWPALRELVAALDATSWSSWQTTARFAGPLERARTVLVQHAEFEAGRREGEAHMRAQQSEIRAAIHEAEGNPPNYSGGRAR